MLTPDEYQELSCVYLTPTCAKCQAGHGTHLYPSEQRLWCEDPQDPCEECGKPWVKYNLAPEQENLTKGAQTP